MEMFAAEYLEVSEAAVYGEGTTPSCQYNSATGILYCQHRYILDL